METNDLVRDTSLTRKQPDNVEVQLLIGQMYLNKGAFAEAFDMFVVAAQSGQPQTLNMLGRAYEQGWGVTRSVAHAIKYFESAADQGDGWACFNLGDLYLAGDGVEANPQLAFRYYVQAARSGVNKALNMLGTLCESGLATGQPDKEKARLYFQAGAEAEDCWAAFNIGRICLEEKNDKKALYWFERSLSYGFPAYWQMLEVFLSKTRLPLFLKVSAKARELIAGPSGRGKQSVLPG
ncbi:hypothetical protein ATPR_2005 [Acetobacter tropicalis NBRC 101654]|uniref:Sel1 repeat family protein n=1 Tax=Acetobacter tropicalis NBRC 101654 TaxID=749388 RepID=F7VF56_9PROT|nr:tetratricopeptide repeat protein [Acetobacter tropicalis]GAA09001.1 hypothetical protein ATPR_2005 [Acetobacter tropicalis NBRC 101654]